MLVNRYFTNDFIEFMARTIFLFVRTRFRIRSGLHTYHTHFIDVCIYYTRLNGTDYLGFLGFAYPVL